MLDEVQWIGPWALSWSGIETFKTGIDTSFPWRNAGGTLLEADLRPDGKGIG